MPALKALGKQWDFVNNFCSGPSKDTNHIIFTHAALPPSCPPPTKATRLCYEPDGAPTPSEILLCVFFVAESSGPDLEAVSSWANGMMELAVDYTREGWEPSAMYNQGKGRIHPLLAHGLGSLVLTNKERRRAISLALAHEGIIVDTSSVDWYLKRLRSS